MWQVWSSIPIGMTNSFVCMTTHKCLVVATWIAMIWRIHNFWLGFMKVSLKVIGGERGKLHTTFLTFLDYCLRKFLLCEDSFRRADPPHPPFFIVSGFPQTIYHQETNNCWLSILNIQKMRRFQDTQYTDMCMTHIMQYQDAMSGYVYFRLKAP